MDAKGIKSPIADFTSKSLRGRSRQGKKKKDAKDAKGEDDTSSSKEVGKVNVASSVVIEEIADLDEIHVIASSVFDDVHHKARPY